MRKILRVIIVSLIIFISYAFAYVDYFLESETKLIPRELGISVSTNGDKVLIGALEAGAAYVYGYNGSEWIEEAELSTIRGWDDGQLVSMSNDVLIAGAVIYRYNGADWIEESRLSSDNPWSVCIDEDVVIIGLDNFVNIFRYNRIDWLEEARFEATDLDMAYDYGKKVSISGDVAVAGAFGSSGLAGGGIYVYRYNGSSWIEEAKIKHTEWWMFPRFLSVSGDIIVASYMAGIFRGCANVFRYVENKWILEAQLINWDGHPGDQMLAISVSDNMIVGGAPGHEAGISNQGAVYVWNYDDGNWVEELKLIASDAGNNDFLGKAVSVSENIIVARNLSGAVYLFKIRPENTPIGNNIVVEFTEGVVLTFNEVSKAGYTSLRTSICGPPPPIGFKLGAPPTYYEITTTAEFSGLIKVCIDYSGINYGTESKLKLLHHEDTNDDGIPDKWVDRTSSLDTTNDVICAVVDSFSFFGIFEPQTPQEAIHDLINKIIDLNLNPGIEMSLTNKLRQSIHNLDLGNEKAAIRLLDSFIKEVEGLRGNHINDENATELIEVARKIIDAITHSGFTV